MKRLLLAAFLFVGCAERHNVGVASEGPRSTSEIEVHFSPKGGCESAVIRHIDAAKMSIRVQAYSFTSKPIADALIRAKARGVDVSILLDKSDEKEKSELPDFQAAGVPTKIDAVHHIAHNKVMILDSSEVETGSYNYSFSAEHSNAENCLFIKDSGLVEEYRRNWESHSAHSQSPPSRTH